MWPFKKKNNSAPNDDEIIWYPVGSENPFNAPVINIRSYTLNMVTGTGSKSVAENYNLSRKSNGSEFIGKDPNDPVYYTIQISYPHNGEKIEGIVYKSPNMEVKWDIYAYDEWFYFVRSWSSQLVFKAKYKNEGDKFIITEIVAPKTFSQKESENIHSIMLTHVLGKVWPFYISEQLQDADNYNIAVSMFSQFGSKATIATKESVLKIKKVKREL